MRRTFYCLMVLALMTPATVVSGQSGEFSRITLPSDPALPDYVIQPNDLIRVVVWDEERLSGQFLVRPDGKISLPLLQDIQATGQTTVQLRAKIQQSLAQYLDAPNVTVIVDEIGTYEVYVIGRVQNPGAAVTNKPINVLQALSLAGGFTEFADPNKTVILREDGTMFRFDYDRVTEGEDLSQNILLNPGDVVVVP